MIRSKVVLIALSFASALGTPGLALAAPSVPATACGSCASSYSGPQGPFAHRENITGVEPYRVTDTDGKHSRTTVKGAVVNVRPLPGVTREWLQQTLEEHVARMTSGAPMADCPLSVAGATAQVSSTGDAFAVTIQSKNNEAAQEILRRASGLVAR